MLKVGDEAYDFVAESTQGTIQLSNYEGQNVLLIFYPKDNSPV